ncbi:Protein of unknown function, partial [Cotesia congregata]
NTLKQPPVLENSENADNHSERDGEKILITDQPYSPIDIYVNSNSSTNDLYTNDQELSSNVNTIESINTQQVLQPVIIIQDNDFNAVDCKQHTSFDYDEQILELLCEDDPMSHEKLLIDCSNDLQPILKDLKQHTSVDQAISFQRDFNVPLQHGSVGTQNTLVDSTITANHETELSEHNNNKLPSTNDTSPKRPLKEIFTLPSEYLPKKKT